MVHYLPSEIARLIYGYLRLNGCDEAAAAFLRSSPYLDECREFMDTNRFRYYTTINGCSLENILNEHKVFRDTVLSEVTGEHQSQPFRTLVNTVCRQDPSQETSLYACDSTTVKPECHSEILSEGYVDNRGTGEGALKRKLNDDYFGIKNRKLTKAHEIIKHHKEDKSLNSSSNDNGDITQSLICTSNGTGSVQESLIRREDTESDPTKNGTVEDMSMIQISNQEESKTKTNDILGELSTAVVSGKSFGDMRSKEHVDDEDLKDDCDEIEPNNGTIDGSGHCKPNGDPSDNDELGSSGTRVSDGRTSNNGLGVDDESKNCEDISNVKDENDTVYLKANGQDGDNGIVNRHAIDLENSGIDKFDEGCDQPENITDDLGSVIQVLAEITQRVREVGINSIKTIYEENKENRLYVLGITSALHGARDLKKSCVRETPLDNPIPQPLNVRNDGVLDTVGDVTNGEDQCTETEDMGKQTYYPLLIENDTGEPYCISIGDSITLFVRESEID